MATKKVEKFSAPVIDDVEKTIVEPKTYNYCLTDENTGTNYNGFKIMVNGIDCNQFIKNPVGLYEHDTMKVIGKWNNLVNNGKSLTADFCWDEDDEEAMKIKAKVDKGLINGSSVGIKMDEYSYDEENNCVNVLKSTLLEASIVALPADKNAMKFYVDDELLTQDKLDYIKNSLKSNKVNMDTKIEGSIVEDIKNFVENNTEPNQEEELQIIKGIDEIVTPEIPEIPEIEEPKIIENSVKVQEQKFEESLLFRLSKPLNLQLSEDTVRNENLIILKVCEMKKQLDEIEANKLINYVEEAVKSRKILASEKDNYIKLAKIDFDAVKNILDKKPIPEKLIDVIKNGVVKSEENRENWDFIEWADKDMEGLNLMKVNDPERYKKLFNTPSKKRK